MAIVDQAQAFCGVEGGFKWILKESSVDGSYPERSNPDICQFQISKVSWLGVVRKGGAAFHFHIQSAPSASDGYCTSYFLEDGVAPRIGATICQPVTCGENECCVFCLSYSLGRPEGLLLSQGVSLRYSFPYSPWPAYVRY